MTLKKLTKLWRWFAWISPVSWGFNGLATSLYGDVKNKLDSGETVAEFIKDYFGFRHDLLWVVCLALIGSCVFFVPLFVASLKILNFQKRLGGKRFSNMNFSDTILLVEYCLGPNVATM